MNPPFLSQRVHRLNCIIFFVLTNSYGHPHEETMERLEEVGAKVLRTDELGAIIFTLSPSVGVQVGGGRCNLSSQE